MRRLLMAALAAVTLVTTGIALAGSTSPGGTAPTASEQSGLRNAAAPAPNLAAPGVDDVPNGFWSFWKKVRNALKKLREIIDAILQHTNDAPRARGAGFAGPAGFDGIDPVPVLRWSPGIGYPSGAPA